MCAKVEGPNLLNRISFKSCYFILPTFLIKNFDVLIISLIYLINLKYATNYLYRLSEALLRRHFCHHKFMELQAVVVLPKLYQLSNPYHLMPNKLYLFKTIRFCLIYKFEDAFIKLFSDKFYFIEV